MDATKRFWVQYASGRERGPFTAEALERGIAIGHVPGSAFVRENVDGEGRPVRATVVHACRTPSAAPPEHQAAPDERRAAIGTALTLIAGLLMLASGIMTLSGHGSLWMPIVALPLALPGMAMRRRVRTS